jgi:hypothetical protein
MMNEVVFNFEGVNYIVDYEIGETNRILLPDRRLIVAKSWDDKTTPPKPIGLYEEKYSLPDGLGIVEIANRLNAVLAEEDK